MTIRLRLAALVIAAFASTALAADKRQMKIEDLFAFKRVAAPQISPDGKHVVYQVTDVSLEDNKTTTALWVAATDGKTPPRQLTDPKGKRDGSPRWSPDGKTILFDSNRSGASRIWLVSAEGGEPRQITEIGTGASQGIWSPDGTKIAFVSAVYPEFSTKPFAESDKLNRDKDEAKEKSPVKARVFTKLFYRHWDHYVEDKREHLFVCNADGSEPRDATPGDRDAVPTSMTFSSGDDFTFTPDSKHLVFTAVPAKNEAWNTNYDLCRVSISNTSPEWETLTAANKAADSGPKFSPDGKKLAWRAQDKPGYEADKWDIDIAGCNSDGTLTEAAKNQSESLDSSADSFIWSGPDTINLVADFRGGSAVFALGPDEKPKNPIRRFGQIGSISGNGTGPEFVCTGAYVNEPAEIYICRRSSKSDAFFMFPKTRVNEELLRQLHFSRPEPVAVPVQGDVNMHMWILKPPGFDPEKKWPVVYLIHGGPQGAWSDSWSYRWNPMLWAAQGYVIVMPNPRGSSGFGEKFKEEISGDWGGKCYRDLVAGLEYVKKLPYVDTDRLATAGASFGGYMQNWFAVNEIVKNFKCQINHCSVWNFESMWGTTDELWFDEYEHGGLPWEVPGKYREFSPHVKAGNLAKYKVPMLVIQNDLDFRCPIGQGHELFSALQRLGVPSRFINFPDEGHWVLKPKNSEYWHQEVFAWLKKYCPPGGK
jgi:dipeptidyl aminopeptidase/acylaminoacyl peptidase